MVVVLGAKDWPRVPVLHDQYKYAKSGKEDERADDYWKRWWLDRTCHMDISILDICRERDSPDVDCRSRHCAY